MKALIGWLSTLHAPLGRWTPLATSCLFAAAGLTRYGVLRGVAYLFAVCLAVLIGADIVQSFIDGNPFPQHTHPGVALTFPMLAFRVALTLALGGLYSFLLFIGVGPWTPFHLWPVLFLPCSFVAWRNVALWYEESIQFEEELLEEAHASQARTMRKHTGAIH